MYNNCLALWQTKQQELTRRAAVDKSSFALQVAVPTQKVTSRGNDEYGLVPLCIAVFTQHCLTERSQLLSFHFSLALFINLTGKCLHLPKMLIRYSTSSLLQASTCCCYCCCCGYCDEALPPRKTFSTNSFTSVQLLFHFNKVHLFVILS